MSARSEDAGGARAHAPVVDADGLDADGLDADGLDADGLDAAGRAVVARLGLQRHPEGGFYRETFRDAPPSSPSSAPASSTESPSSPSAAASSSLTPAAPSSAAASPSAAPPGSPPSSAVSPSASPASSASPPSSATVDAPARGRLTLIYFLVPSTWTAWHAVDAVETWHFYDGAPVLLSIAGRSAVTTGDARRASGAEATTDLRVDATTGGRDGGASVVDVTLGRDLAAGQELHGVVPAHAWQRARSTGAWSLVGCVVAPAFTFTGFRLAPAGFDPTRPP